MKTVKSAVFTIVTGVAVVIQLMNPVTVYADDKTPPPPAENSISTVEPVDPPKDFAPTESPTVDPVETSTSISTQQETVEPPSDIAEASSTPVPEEWVTETPTRERTPKPPETTTSTPEPTETTSPTETVAVKPPALLESVQAISSDTSVVVLDANGQPLPLVTQEAADIIVSSDPLWCPAGVAPTPGANGCTASYTTMEQLLTNAGAIINSQNVNGTIWITSGPITETNPIVIDGSSLSYSNWANFSLTLQGGWSGISGDTTIGSNSIFSVPITISNWNNNVTVNNITVDNASGTGLTIDTTENVAISNSTFSGNGGDGAYIAHCDPQGCVTSADITISNSTFSGNTGNGASISFGVDTTISNSTFSENDGEGASIGFGTGNVTISNSTFSGNSGDGASIGFVADTTISNSTFSGNSGDGASISFGADATISNSIFSGNSRNGADINSDSITLSNSTFSNNGSNGASVFYGNYAIIYNSFFTGNKIGLQGYPDNLTLNCIHYQDNIQQDEDLRGSGAINITRIPCSEPGEPVVIQFPQLIIVLPDQDSIEAPVDCSQYSSFLVVWSNGDRFLISCVAGGVARITRVDNTALIKDLPAGYEYAAAYNVEIFQHGVSLPVVPAGGFIWASFASRHENPQYGIMVWDEKISNWTLLQEYQKDPSGAPMIFPFDRSNSQDERQILKGTRFISTEDPNREEVTTNFPGTFVLVQQ